MAALLVLLVLFVWTAFLTYKALDRRNVALGTPIFLILVGISLSILFTAMELLFTTFQAMYFTVVLQYVALGFLLWGLGLSLFNYLGWVNQWDIKSAVLLGIMPLIFIIMVATDPWTSFYYSSLQVFEFSGYSYLSTERSWTYWLFVSYVVFLCVAVLALILNSFIGALETNVPHMAILVTAIVGSMLTPFLPNPLALIPNAYIISIWLGLMAYPLYVVTFKEGIFAWSLSYRKVLDLEPDIKVIIGRDHVLYYNRRAKEALGDPPQLPAEIQESLVDMGKGSVYEDIKVIEGGEERYYDFDILPLTSRIGRYQATMVSMKDTTDEVRARRAFELANEKLQLLSSISRHDMLNQLTVLTGMNYMLENILTDERSQRMTRSMTNATDAIIRQLMFMKDYDLIGSTPPEWIRLSEVLDDAAENQDLEDVEVRSEMDDYEIYADPMLSKVFENLIHNTMNHGEGVGFISLKTEETAEGLTLHYHDDGGGIPPDFQEGLFDKGVGRHSGLGLFLSKQILDVTGLGIAEQGVPGEGVHFTIQVPKGRFKGISD